jgi:hypothetical protein
MKHRRIAGKRARAEKYGAEAEQTQVETRVEAVGLLQ